MMDDTPKDPERRSTAIQDQFRAMGPLPSIIMHLTEPMNLALISIWLPQLNAIHDTDARLSAAMALSYYSKQPKFDRAVVMFGSWGVGIVGGAFAFAALGVPPVIGMLLGGLIGYWVIWGTATSLSYRRYVKQCLDDFGYVKCEVCSALYNNEIPCDCGRTRDPGEVGNYEASDRIVTDLRGT